jgi:quinoprotein glucose dehydrogenase
MRHAPLSLTVFLLVALLVWTLAGRAADGDRDWPAYGGDKASTKYSPLDQINQGTVGGLQIAWRRSGLPEELRPSFPDAQAPANYQHTPLVVGGLMYMSSAVGAVVALDPATGRTVWFDSLPPRPDGQGLARGGATRSLAYWTDGRDARIVTNVGASLVALDAKTGKRYPDFGDNGQVDLTKGFERPITGWRWSSGPIVVKDVVVVAGVPSPATDILNERARAPK